MRTEIHRLGSRLSDLSPFDPQEWAVPIVPLAHVAPGAGSHEGEEPDGEFAYGCVEWFRYPRKRRGGQHSGLS